MPVSQESVAPESVDVTNFYREKMYSYLRESPLPPTDWELKNHHEHLHQEALTRFRSISVEDDSGRRSSSPPFSPARSSSLEASKSSGSSPSETLTAITERLVEESINEAFSEAKKCHKEMRSKVLIDSVLGKKNYVDSH